MFKWWQCVSRVPKSSVSDQHAEAPLLILGQSLKVNVEHPRLPNGDPKGKGKALVQYEPSGPTGC